MDKEYFWSISIEPGQIQAAVWTIHEENAQVISVAPPAHWEEIEDIVLAADTTLSGAAQNLPEDAPEPTRTVFGVPPSWVAEGNIRKEFLSYVRAVCDKLSLEPSGFVVMPEAIANFIKMDENVPLNGVIIGISQSVIDVSVFRLGNLAGTVNVARSVSILNDVIEGMTKFAGSDTLPSRLVIYNGSLPLLEEAKEALIQADWMTEYKDKVKFLHTPQVEIIPPDKKLVAITLAGALEIAKIDKIVFNVSDEKQAKPEDNEMSSESAASEMGFVVNEDISEKPLVTAEIENISAPRNAKPKIVLPQISLNLKKLLHLRKPKMNISYNVSSPGRPIIIAFVALFAILAGLFVAWWNLPKAEVIVYVQSKTLESHQKVAIDPNSATVDKDKSLIPGKIIKTSVKGDKTRSATGTKTVGDKAKGSVVIENGTAVNLHLPAGTVLVSSNSLQFTLDTSASVSAAVSPSTPGTANINVTAAVIGADYNLAKTEKFKVGNFPKSEVDAVADKDFSGGSSREIVAVSKDDLKLLEDDLTKELVQQGQNQINDQLSDSQILIEESSVATASSKNFNHKVGDETSTLKLDMTMDVSTLTIEKGNINELATKYLEDQVPQGYVLREGQIQYEFSDKPQKVGGVWEFDVKFSANLLSELKSDEIAKKIAGKSVNDAKAYLKSTIGGYQRSDVIPSPRLPGRLSDILPHISKNITVTPAGD